MTLATFAAGCFWGVQARFDAQPGVTQTTVGYMGGHLDNPDYKSVCTDSTGHAEVVQLEFDPAVVDYPQLLQLFWQLHDPTTLNRQGPDVGSQYRSAVFFHSEEQQQQAEAMMQQLQQQSPRPIVTQIVPAAQFYEAEEYHQKYLAKQGLPSCHL
ncbi:peptide-methionine (S)-S-oxide reductase MsrA [Motiliproteus sp.]|uniref:peptide-methionine (S)-S-oxide reductase MsrA n=1 Tax=Motiliproteus sp. TaxID=1898955 RepID=UPI003BAC47A5